MLTPTASIAGRAVADIDPAMPFLASALDPGRVQQPLRNAFRQRFGRDTHLQVSGVRLMRHKAGRRALIEYDVEMVRVDAPAERLTILGKAHARRIDVAVYQLLTSLRRAGFDERADDGIAVPSPLGMVPEFQMVVLQKMNGTPLGELLTGSDACALMTRAAEAACKLHRTAHQPRRSHTAADEIAILGRGLDAVAAIHPAMAPRLAGVMRNARALASQLGAAPQTGIHRDFYPDQLLVDADRMYLLDLDLYATGDPALDAGNFIGHLTEWSLRRLGTPDALAAAELAFESRFVEQTGEWSRRHLRIYAALTLARHIFISTRFPDRQAFTGTLLDVCEERVSRLQRESAGMSA